MLQQYIPILIFMLVAIGLAVAMITIAKFMGWYLNLNRPSREKNSAFECGFPAFADARAKFDVRFYLVAILFIVFDLEVAFLFPFSVVMTKIGWYGFGAMGVFLLLLVVGFVFEWRKGALEWE